MSDVRDVVVGLKIRIVGESHSQRTGVLHYEALCPHHYDGKKLDHTPSWDINAETGAHYCHSCGFGGSLEWLIHILTGAPLQEAKRQSGEGARALSKVRRMDPWGGERPVALPPMNESRIKMYGRPPEWALQARRISEQTARMFDIRWADTFVHGIEKTEYTNCWITPIRDPDTFAAIGMQVKQQDAPQPGQPRFFRNLPASVPKSTTVFGVETLTHVPKLHVVESPLDAAYGEELGFRTVSTMSADISPTQMELLIASTDCLIFALDDDDAGWSSVNHLLGMNARGRRMRNLQDYSKRIEIRIADYKYANGKKDVGECTPDVARQIFRGHMSALRFRLGSA